MSAEKKPRSRGKGFLVMSGWVLLAAVGGAGIVYGPELVSLVRLGNEIDTIAAKDAQLGGAWPRATDACIYCHGFEGNARAQNYPRLAGQSEAYLKKQLAAFASGERQDPSMTPLALSMREEDMSKFAAHFAKMAPLPNDTFKADPDRVKRGAELAAARGCVACHGAQLEGKGEFPRLAGQGADYLRDQLLHFKSGSRRDPSGAMQGIAAALAPQDIDDLVHYMASK